MDKYGHKIELIAKKYGLKLVVLFGSFANGKNREESDVDIAVLSEDGISFEKQIGLTNEFSRVFSRNADITVLNHANPLLLFQVSKNSVLLYGEKSEFAKFKLRAFHAFNDYAPYFRMEKELNKKMIKSYAN